jgi:hypothetical protein
MPRLLILSMLLRGRKGVDSSLSLPFVYFDGLVLLRRVAHAIFRRLIFFDLLARQNDLSGKNRGFG